jgi:hypothetical protein
MLMRPPALGLLAWNIGVYAWLAWHALRAGTRRGEGDAMPLRSTLVRLGARLPRRAFRGERPVPRAARALVAAWSRVAAPLYAARAARILHLAAAVFAIGMLAGLYVRGLAFEYRATWESTFLDAGEVHALLRIVLAPASALTGIPVPDVTHLESVRTGATPGGENAAPWLHLWAATLGLVVIAPRLLLSALAAMIEAGRARRLRLPLQEPYYQRLVRVLREGPIDVEVLPYSYHLPAGAHDGLARVVARAFGPAAHVRTAAPVTYGGEDTLQRKRDDDAHPVVALFNLAATPEGGNHGAFAATLAAFTRWPLVALVDEGPLRERVQGDPERLEARRHAWREVLEGRGVRPVFVDLTAPDLDAAEVAIERILEAGHRGHS